jgi:hypothetical protein
MSSSRRRKALGRMGRSSTFVDDVLAGKATAADIHDYIAAWHDAPDGSSEAKVELHDYLGLTWNEYQLWGEHPESIRFTMAARRAQVPLETVLAEAKTVGVAARSTEGSDAVHVLQWLIDRGRVSASVRNI